MTDLTLERAPRIPALTLPKAPTIPAARLWPYIGTVLGAVVSIGANVLHSYVPPDQAAADWAPQVGAIVGSIFWPLGLLVALEILTRVEWPDERLWTAVRWGGLVPVAVVAAVVSYRHMSGLLAYWGEDRVTQLIGPLAVDGLMVLASGALLIEPAKRRRASRQRRQVTSPDVAVQVTAEPRPVASRPALERQRRVTPRKGAPGDVVTAELVARRAAGLSRHDAVLEVADLGLLALRSVQRHAAKVWGEAA